MSNTDRRVTIYTDGGCRPNPGPGGWGAVFLYSDGSHQELKGGDKKTTNNRMELTAAIEALRTLDGSWEIELYTDSEYLRRGVTQWMHRWRKAGWRTAGKTEVKNRDLWESLSEALEQHTLHWHWTRGHSGDRWNERADQLASSAIPKRTKPRPAQGDVQLYAAISWSKKRGGGAWAASLIYGEHRLELDGTSQAESANRLHLESVIYGLEALKKPSRIVVHTTSDYIADGSMKWVKGWRQRGWMTREGKPVKHRDLWQRLEALAQTHQIEWQVTTKTEMPDEAKVVKLRASDVLKGEPEDSQSDGK
ncbi:MAG: ribonuclease HI [bacterium]|nr:ribonuclease HI [bacterium]